MSSYRTTVQFTLATPGGDELYLDADCSFYHQPAQAMRSDQEPCEETLELETCYLYLPGHGTVDLMKTMPKAYVQHIEEEVLGDLQDGRRKRA